MKVSVVSHRFRRVAFAAAALVALSGCVNVRYDDEHADPASRLASIASRFNRATKVGGMSGVSADIEECYRAASVPLIKRFALQDCLVYDYTASEYDRQVGRQLLNGARFPYFEDHVTAARLGKYGKLDGFGDNAELIAFLTPRRTLVLAFLQRMPGSILAPVPSTSRPRGIPRIDAF